jgi:hypothetical protein
MPRDKRTVKFTRKIFGDEMGLRLATPEVVAEYIARRLKTNIVSDLGCGIGGQVIFFARESRLVNAVEVDPNKLDYARRNCRVYGLNNVRFILGDALSEEVLAQVRDSDIIFSDPARPLSEKERTFETLQPAIPKILQLYSSVTSEFAFHAPPQISPTRVAFDCEREYLSLHGELNRLTLYFGALKRCERSAVVLPSYARLESKEAKPIEQADLLEYAYEPDPSTVKASLLGELARETRNLYFFRGDARRTLLTSDSLVKSPFLKNSYRVLGKMELDYAEVKRFLAGKNAGKVVLRLDVSPGEYWDMRKRLETGLKGSRIAHLFALGNEAIVLEKL